MLHPQINEVTLESLDQVERFAFDEIIDVRSPAEFQLDHLPRAINLPVLNDTERHIVGSQYKSEGPFVARQKGATIISLNISQIIDRHLAFRNAVFQPLIYCWRGGQRSGSLAEVCRQIGWQTSVIRGGYKQYRRLVFNYLYQTPFPFRVILLSGNTGTAKTEILELLSGMDTQVMNLEGLANHRGSIFGRLEIEQPSQKMFESRIVSELVKLDPGKPLLLEAESQKIGKLAIPPALWMAMKAAPRIRVEAKLEDRARYIKASYKDLVVNSDGITETLEKLAPFHPRPLISQWYQLANSKAYLELASQLMRFHYDPRYGRQDSLYSLEMTDLSSDTVHATAERIAEIISTMSRDSQHPNER